MHLPSVLVVLAASLTLAQQAEPTPAQQLSVSRDAAPSTTPAPMGDFTTTQHIVLTGTTDSYVTRPDKTIDIAIPTCVQTITPDKNGHVPPGTCGAIWSYYPSFAAAAAFAIIFAVMTALHVFLAARHKKRWCWVIIMACVWETLAFTFRAISAKMQQNSGIYLIFQIFILLAPLWINAFAYMILGRMIHFFTPSHSLMGIPASVIAAGFVSLDVISFIVQLIGGGMAGPTAPPEEQMRAIHIYMGGIGAQEAFIVLFVCFTVKFQTTMTKLAQSGSTSHLPSWKPLLWALYFSVTMITVRIIFRLVEFSSGSHSNTMTTHEGYFYALEAVPMLLALGVFVVVHPGTILQGPGAEMPGMFSLVKTLCGRRRGREMLDDEEGHTLNTTWKPSMR